jgi:glucoamylase
MADDAPGAPGLPPTWSPGPKDLATTSLGAGRVWVTIGQGILHEVYWPTAGEPQTRDLGFIVAGPGWWDEAKVVPGYQVSTPAPDVPLPTIVRATGRWRLTLEVIPMWDLDAVLVRYHLDGAGAVLHPLLAPHLELHDPVAPNNGQPVGYDGLAWLGSGGELLARRAGRSLCLLADPAFILRSAGHVGVSDGWQDFHANGAMTWSYPSAGPGNVALMGRLPGGDGLLALAFAEEPDAAATVARQALALGAGAARTAFTAGWQAWAQSVRLPAPMPANPPGLADALRRSAAVIRVHEDRRFPGALVAGLSIPWGQARSDISGYHLVWPRDAVEAALAQIALGQVEDAARLLAFLVSTQQADGHWQQNLFPDGTPFWTGVQLDETALPVLLAANLAEAGHPLPPGTAGMVRRAIQFLVRKGPLTDQDRWEENPGGSPFTLGVIVCALVAAGDLLPDLTADESAYLHDLADSWNERIEEWTFAVGAELTEEQRLLCERYGVPGYYVRIGPPPAAGDPDGTAAGPRGFVDLKNQQQGVRVGAALVVGLEFLYLVRLGLRQPDDQRVLDSVRVADGELAADVGTGTAYHRYDRDGYGETADGGPFVFHGIGRPWPLLAGERGHYEVLAGRDPVAQLAAMTAMTGPGGLLPEQVWDAADVPAAGLFRGHPTGSAMPLVWAHSELARLVVAWTRGRPVEQLESVRRRYPDRRPVPARRWQWRCQVPVRALPKGRDLVVEATEPFTLHWGHDGWQDPSDVDAAPVPFGLYAVTLPAAQIGGYRMVELTRRFASGWEQQYGQWHEVRLTDAPLARLPAVRR